MANNPYVNKLVYGGETKFDLTDTTATAGDVAAGKVFYNAAGARTLGTNTGGGGNMYYGTCSTAAGTAAKTVAMDGFALSAGARVTVKFTYALTADNPTLNVNSTGAKNVVYYGTARAVAGFWGAGELVDFVYDGTNWAIVDGLTRAQSVYSETETVIGSWRGSTLYRKCFSMGSTAQTPINQEHYISNFGESLNLYGMLRNGTTWYPGTFPNFNGGGTNASGSFLAINETHVRYYPNTNMPSTQQLYIIAEYTKTI